MHDGYFRKTVVPVNLPPVVEELGNVELPPEEEGDVLFECIEPDPILKAELLEKSDRAKENSKYQEEIMAVIN